VKERLSVRKSERGKGRRREAQREGEVREKPRKREGEGDRRSPDPPMVTFDEDEQGEKMESTDEPISEEIDKRDWVPESLIVEARRLDGNNTTMVCAFFLIIPPCIRFESGMCSVRQNLSDEKAHVVSCGM
jgi:hypothetical protein